MTAWVFRGVLVGDAKAIPIPVPQKEDAAADQHLDGPKNRPYAD